MPTGGSIVGLPARRVRAQAAFQLVEAERGHPLFVSRVRGDDLADVLVAQFRMELVTVAERVLEKLLVVLAGHMHIFVSRMNAIEPAQGALLLTAAGRWLG